MPMGEMMLTSNAGFPVLLSSHSEGWRHKVIGNHIKETVEKVDDWAAAGLTEHKYEAMPLKRDLVYACVL